MGLPLLHVLVRNVRKITFSITSLNRHPAAHLSSYLPKKKVNSRLGLNILSNGGVNSGAILSSRPLYGNRLFDIFWNFIGIRKERASVGKTLYDCPKLIY